MTDLRPIHRLEQLAYDAVRSNLATPHLRKVLTGYLAYWGLLHGNTWSRLSRRGLFEVISPADKILADRVEGGGVIVLARAGDSDKHVAHRCNRMLEEGAAYTFVVVDHLVRTDVLPAYMDLCDALFFTPMWVGNQDKALPYGCHEIRSRPLDVASIC